MCFDLPFVNAGVCRELHLCPLVNHATDRFTCRRSILTGRGETCVIAIPMSNVLLEFG